MPILPDQFEQHSALALLRDLEMGLAGFDHRLIRRLLATPEETAEAVATLAEAPGDDRVVELEEQIFDLFRCLNTPLAAEFYVLRLRQRDDAGVSDELIEAMRAIAPSMAGPLLDLASGDDPEAADAVFVLSTLGIQDPRIQAAIEKTLEEDIYEGALCAGLYRSSNLAPALQSALDRLTPEQEQERKAVEDALLEIASPQGEEVSEPFDIYALYPEVAFPLFEILPESTVSWFLVCESAEYRMEAAFSLLDSDYKDETRDLLLKLSQEDPDPGVRGAALAALGERLDDLPVREALYTALRNAELTQPERRGVLIGLASEGGKPEVEKAILSAYEDPELRAWALEAMYRSVEERFAEKFPANLSHEDTLVRRQAIRGIGVFGIESAALHLVPIFQDAELREDALYSYALAAPGKTTEKGVHRLFEEIEAKADGLTASESEVVGSALDQRLEREGLEPVFFPEEEHSAHEPVRSEKVGRNDPCPCGSGKKYKKCCGAVV